jgi:thiol-disulfide isomerase/thioredoxin
VGDRVLEVGGVALTGGTQEMIARVKSHAEGATLALVVERDGERRPLSVVLAKVPDRKAMVEDQWKGRALPDLGLVELGTRKKLDPAALGGKVTVLNYWATWCGPCKQAMPILEELQGRLGKRGLRIVGVADEEPEVLERFLANRPVEYAALAYDPEHHMASDLYIASYPTFVVVGPDGKVARVLLGAGGAKELEGVVSPLLGP